jgi:two-component system sensor histidine kinase YesM
MMNKASFRRLNSFRNRVILIFFMIIIVPFLLFAYYTHIKSIEGISNANTRISLSYLLQTKKNFELYLTKLNDQINVLIGNKQLQEYLEKPPQTPQEEESFTVNLLTSLYQTMPAIDAFRVHVYPIRPSLYPTYMSTIGESADLEYEPWFQRSKASISPTWNLFMPEKGKYAKPLITYIKRFSGLYDQIPRGIVSTDLSEDQLKRFFAPSEQMVGQKLLLLNEQGIVIFDSVDNKWTGGRVPVESFYELMKSGSRATGSIDIQGTAYLPTYLRMDDEPWTIVSLTPLAELTGTIQEINRLFIVFLVLYLIGCMFVVVYLTIYFTQPIAQLVRHMRKVDKEDLQHLHLSSSRKDEVGWLYREFDSLIHKIEGLVEAASLSERKKKELEFQVLSHQINPHFLYNTLESIRWKAEIHGRSEISEMVSALGNLLRLSLNQGKEITTLGREIEQVKAYVWIEQARMGQNVRILYAFDEDTLELPLLRLLLQPLIENAIQHSIRDDFDKRKILLSGRREADDIIIEIADNGEGIPEETLRKLQEDTDGNVMYAQTHKGVGLRNVNDRLRLYFGDNYKLTIESGKDIGTKITIKHPILEET